MSKEKPICTYCGSDDVSRDAYAKWDIDTQEWEIITTFDSYYCEDCDGETSIEWKDIDG